jgi:hypothetical protein
MEKSNKTSSTPSNKSFVSKYKSAFWWLVLWTLLFGSCQTNDDVKSHNSQIDKVMEITDGNQNPIDIHESWEYKIYRLWLGSVAPVKWDIKKARTKIEKTPELLKILDDNDIKFEKIMPIIIKESMMKNNSRSKSWAVWYFQLRPIAVKDVEKYYGIEDLKLDANNPIDNIILWCLYVKRSLILVKKWLDVKLSDSDWEKMMFLSYNVWPATVKKLFIESKASNYREFERFLAKRIWVKKSPVKKIDSVYKVEYMDPLVDLDLSTLKSGETKKIAEWLKYVAIIDWISWYMNEAATMQILWKIKLNDNTSLFSEVKRLKDLWIFKKDAPIDKICDIILGSNWFSEKSIPKWAELLVIQNVLTKYLQ